MRAGSTSRSHDAGCSSRPSSCSMILRTPSAPCNLLPGCTCCQRKRKRISAAGGVKLVEEGAPILARSDAAGGAQMIVQLVAVAQLDRQLLQHRGDGFGIEARQILGQKLAGARGHDGAGAALLQRRVVEEG